MFWTDTMKLGAAFWDGARTLGETATASHAVVAHRSRTIDAAMRDPMSADMTELGLMVPEKMTAFAKAGAAMLEDWMSLQTDAFEQTRDFATIAASGATLSPATLERMGRRASRMTMRMGLAGGRALAPIHAAATANQRRLAKTKS